MKARPGHEHICTLASGQDHATALGGRAVGDAPPGGERSHRGPKTESPLGAAGHRGTASAPDHEPIAERTGLSYAGRGDATRLIGVEGAGTRVCTDVANKTLPLGSGRERSSTGATACSTEPCDRAVRRSARRLNILGSRASASRLPGRTRPTDGGNRPAGGNARDFFAAEMPCATRDSERDEQDGRPVDRQLGRIPLGALTGLGLLAQCIEGVALWLIAAAAIAVACLV